MRVLPAERMLACFASTGLPIAMLGAADADQLVVGEVPRLDRNDDPDRVILNPASPREVSSFRRREERGRVLRVVTGDLGGDS